MANFKSGLKAKEMFTDIPKVSLKDLQLIPPSIRHKAVLRDKALNEINRMVLYSALNPLLKQLERCDESRLTSELDACDAAAVSQFIMDRHTSKKELMADVFSILGSPENFRLIMGVMPRPLLALMKILCENREMSLSKLDSGIRDAIFAKSLRGEIGRAHV